MNKQGNKGVFGNYQDLRGNFCRILHDNDLTKCQDPLSVPAPRGESITRMRLADCSSLVKTDMADTSNTRKEDTE